MTEVPTLLVDNTSVRLIYNGIVVDKNFVPSLHCAFADIFFTSYFVLRNTTALVALIKMKINLCSELGLVDFFLMAVLEKAS